jgi:hypothetical protein
MNRTLTPLELASANALLEEIRRRLKDLAGGDASLHFAIRRKVYKELAYDERSKPAHRKVLKAFKREAQGGLCASCKQELPQREALSLIGKARKQVTRAKILGSFARGATKRFKKNGDGGDRS